MSNSEIKNDVMSLNTNIYDGANKEKISTKSIKKRISEIINQNKFNINSNNYDYQKQLLFFKNDILRDIRNFESKQAEQIFSLKEEQTQKINLYEKRLSEQNEKITYLSNLIADYFRKEKFENYVHEFKANFEKNIAGMEAKIYLLQNDIKDVLVQQKIFFNENVLYPGIIGYGCKFKDLHAFVDYVLDSINEIFQFQELMKNFELHKIRKNLEYDLNALQLQIKNNFRVLSSFTTEKINESEQKMKKLLDDYNTQFVDVRLENNKNANEIQKRIDEVTNNFDQIIQIKKEINEKNEEQEKKMENIINDIHNNENKIMEHNQEMITANKKFNLLTSYIDDTVMDNSNEYYSGYHYNKSPKKRIQSAKEFIERNLRFNSDENKNNRTIYNNALNYYNNKRNNVINNNLKTINSQPSKSYVINKKMVFSRGSVLKQYISGKIGVKDMQNHPKDSINDKNKLKIYDTSPTLKNRNLSPINDNSKIFNLTKLQSPNNNQNYTNNNNYKNNKYITKSLSDGNYNFNKNKVLSHENFMNDINNILNRKNKYNQILTSFNNNLRRASYNKLLQEQISNDKKFNNAFKKKKKKLLIIQ